ncbi:MAG: hypothetical protein SNJ82_03445 [Gemmataceae bacterium]
MSRRSFLLGLSVFALLIVGSMGLAWLLLRYEPRWYAHRCRPAEEQTRKSRECSSRLIELYNATQRPGPFSIQFGEEQFNSYLAEGIHRQGVADKLLPEGVTEPRVHFQEDRVLVAFRYRNGLINTVVSVSLKVWLPSSEPNLLVVQLESLKAGLIPISAQWLLEEMSESLRNRGTEVTWYRHEGCPAALLRLQADLSKPTLLLSSVELSEGLLTVHGETSEGRLTSRK